MFLLLSSILSFELNTRYYLKGSFPSPNTLTLEKGTIRFTEPEILIDKPDKVKKIILISKNADNTYKIAFENGKFLCKKEESSYGVITCDASTGISDWEITDMGNNNHVIKIKGKCLKVHKYDERFKGYYAQATQCKDEPNEKFSFEKVIDKEDIETKSSIPLPISSKIDEPIKTTSINFIDETDLLAQQRNIPPKDFKIDAEPQEKMNTEKNKMAEDKEIENDPSISPKQIKDLKAQKEGLRTCPYYDPDHETHHI
ncbi:hypothetical protein GVAV_001375 [Gurleya vavrai]